MFHNSLLTVTKKTRSSATADKVQCATLSTGAKLQEQLVQQIHNNSK